MNLLFFAVHRTEGIARNLGNYVLTMKKRFVELGYVFNLMFILRVVENFCGSESVMSCNYIFSCLNLSCTYLTIPACSPTYIILKDVVTTTLKWILRSSNFLIHYGY